MTDGTTSSGRGEESASTDEDINLPAPRNHAAVLARYTLGGIPPDWRQWDDDELEEAKRMLVSESFTLARCGWPAHIESARYALALEEQRRRR